MQNESSGKIGSIFSCVVWWWCLLVGHIDGVGVPPFLLRDASPTYLQNTFLSVIIDGINAPISFIYEGPINKNVSTY